MSADTCLGTLLTSREQDAALNRAMDRYAAGDDAVFAEIFRLLGPRLRAFLRRLSGSADSADDLLQETLLRIHHARGSFTPGRATAPWAYAIARNCYISHVRSPKHRLSRSSVALIDESAVGGLEASAEEATMAKQAALAVETALQGMSEARRSAFVLVRYEGLSVAEAAQVLGITESALKVRAFHAYEVLRQALETMERPAPSTLQKNALSA